MVKKGGLPSLIGGALTLGAARLAGGALTAVGGLASLTSTALGIGKSVVGGGISAIKGGAKALGFGGSEIKQKGQSALLPPQRNEVKQTQQKAEKSDKASTAKISKVATDTSRKADKQNKNTTSILSAMKGTLEKISGKIDGIIKGMTAEQKAESRSALEGKIEGARGTDSGGGASPSLLERSKGIVKGATGFLSGIFKGLLRYFLLKIVALAMNPELKKSFQEFEGNVVKFFKSSFSAIVKLFKGDFKGAKKDAGEALGSLVEILKSVAKFASGIIDKIAKAFGFEEPKLYDEAAKKIKDQEKKIKKFVDEKSDLDEKKPFKEKLFDALKNVAMEIMAKIAGLFTLENMTKIIAGGIALRNSRKDTEKSLERVNDPDKGFFSQIFQDDRIKKAETEAKEMLGDEYKRAGFENLLENVPLSGNYEGRGIYQKLLKKEAEDKLTTKQAKALQFLKETIEPIKEENINQILERQKEIEKRIKGGTYEKEPDHIKMGASGLGLPNLNRFASKKLSVPSGQSIGQASSALASVRNTSSVVTNNRGGDNITTTTTNVASSGGGAPSGLVQNPENSFYKLQSSYTA